MKTTYTTRRDVTNLCSPLLKGTVAPADHRERAGWAHASSPCPSARAARQQTPCMRLTGVRGLTPHCMTPLVVATPVTRSTAAKIPQVICTGLGDARSVLMWGPGRGRHRNRLDIAHRHKEIATPQRALSHR